MPDLDAKIRETISAALNRLYNGDDMMAAALLVVLDLHPAEPHECPQRDANGDDYTAYELTCPTRRAIAAELGIEVPRG